MNYDRNQIKEWIGKVEDDLAAFVGADMDVAHLIAVVRKAHNEGVLDEQEAQTSLDCLRRIWRLIEVGRKFGKWVRNPPAEVEILVMTALKDELKEDDDD